MVSILNMANRDSNSILLSMEAKEWCHKIIIMAINRCLRWWEVGININKVAIRNKECKPILQTYRTIITVKMEATILKISTCLLLINTEDHRNTCKWGDIHTHRTCNTVLLWVMDLTQDHNMAKELLHKVTVNLTVNLSLPNKDNSTHHHNKILTPSTNYHLIKWACHHSRWTQLTVTLEATSSSHLTTGILIHSILPINPIRKCTSLYRRPTSLLRTPKQTVSNSAILPLQPSTIKCIQMQAARRKEKPRTLKYQEPWVVIRDRVIQKWTK